MPCILTVAVMKIPYSSDTKHVIVHTIAVTVTGFNDNHILTKQQEHKQQK
jgi:VCBS repeat-containing protein